MDRRRRLGCLIAAAAVALILALTWWLLPRLACAVVNASLPREFGPEAVLISVSADCGSLPPPEVQLQADPSLIRSIGTAASRRWIPPGLVRSGLGAIGALRCDNGISIPWRAEAAAGVSPPRLAVTLTPAQADALIASAGGTVTVAGFDIAPHLASLECAEVAGLGTDRRFRIEAAGALHLHAGTLKLDVPVRRLAGTIDLSFTPASAGWEPAIRVHVDELDAPLPTLPGVDRGAWKTLLEDAIQGRIDDRLGGRCLPAWFPLDLHASAVVR